MIRNGGGSTRKRQAHNNGCTTVSLSHIQQTIRPVVLKHLRIEDECRLTGMEALLLEHFLNVFNGVLELDLKFDRFSTFDLCLYEDLVTSRTSEVDIFIRFHFDYKAKSNYTVIVVPVTIDSDEFFIVCKLFF